jgi:hypothetical protein
MPRDEARDFTAAERNQHQVASLGRPQLQGLRRGPSGRGRAASGSAQGVGLGAAGGQVRIEHVTLRGVDGQTVADGGGDLQWDRVDGPPTEIRGFSTLATELGSGPVVDIPVDVTGAGIVVLDWKWGDYPDGFKMSGDIVLTRTRDGVTASKTVTVTPATRRGDGVTEGWEFRAGDTLTVRFPNGSGSPQTLAACTVEVMIWDVSQAASTVPVPAYGYDEAVLADSPDAYFLLRETSGTSAADEQGGAAGTYVDNGGLALSGLTTPDGYGSMGCTTGAGAWVTLGDRFAYSGVSPFTVSIMAYIGDNNGATLVCRYYDNGFDTLGSPMGWEVEYLSVTPSIRVRRQSGATVQTATVVIPGSPPSQGFWVVAAVIYDGTTLTAVADGVSASVASSVSIPSPNLSNNPYALVNAYKGPTHGGIRVGGRCRVAFWSRALTVAELQAHFATVSGVWP